LQANAANVAAGREIEPAGFGPLPRTWPQRSSKLGTYDDKWLKERWPWFAEDFDWRYHNAAPEDLQVDGYLRGDEHLYFENLHPVHSQYHSRLPGMTVRCFLLELADPTDSRGSFREVTMNLDTLWVDMDSECLVLVWRGVAEVASDENEKIEHVYLETENLDTPTQTHEYYEALFRERLAAVERHEEEVVSTERSVGTDAAAEEDELEAVDQELAAAEVERRATLNAAGIDPDERPPIASAQTAEAEAQLLKELGLPWEEATEPSDVDLTREMVQERLARAEGLVGEDLRTLDLSDLQMQGADLQRALLADAVVRNATLSNANLTAANLELADLSGADLRRATLKDADLTGANLAGADLTGANLQGAIFEKARLEGAILDDVMGDDAHFTAASLTSVRARNGMFVGADFSAAVLTRADFRGSNLREASMDAVEAVEINMSTTNLTAWRASEGADFSRGLFRKIVGPDSIWQNANLTGADLSFAELPNADFSGAVLANADLYAANVREARFVKANLTDAQLVKIDLFQGSLEKANLQRTNLSDSNLYGVELLGCDLEGVRTERANLKMTKLSGE
jgi:uncharacterized protein YjbI with pentapeptide repeats